MSQRVLGVVQDQAVGRHICRIISVIDRSVYHLERSVSQYRGLLYQFLHPHFTIHSSLVQSFGEHKN